MGGSQPTLHSPRHCGLSLRPHTLHGRVGKSVQSLFSSGPFSIPNSLENSVIAFILFSLCYRNPRAFSTAWPNQATCPPPHFYECTRCWWAIPGATRPFLCKSLTGRVGILRVSLLYFPPLLFLLALFLSTGAGGLGEGEQFQGVDCAVEMIVPIAVFVVSCSHSKTGADGLRVFIHDYYRSRRIRGAANEAFLFNQLQMLRDGIRRLPPEVLAKVPRGRAEALRRNEVAYEVHYLLLTGG